MPDQPETLTPLTLDDAIKIGQLYTNAVQRGYQELIIMLAECPACGAGIDEQCVGQYNQRTVSMHCDRKNVVERYRKANREDYHRTRDQVIQLFFKLALEKEGLI